MHVSRFGDRMLGLRERIGSSASGARSSEVRVSYFDPLTGEPLDRKPKPRRARRKELTRAQRDAAYRAAVAEGEAIAEGMRQRRASQPRKPSGRGGYRRAVLVDGIEYESVTAAAKAMGTSEQHLGKRLRAGAETVKGHAVAFAEGEVE